MATTTKIYPYVSPQPSVLIPWIPVSLGSKKTHKVIKHSVMALVDSGADCCLISEDIVAFLGEMIVDDSKKQKKQLRAADGQLFSAYKVTLTLYACGHNYECPFYVTNTLPQNAPLILGQQGFFSQHIIQFDLRKREILITPY